MASWINGSCKGNWSSFVFALSFSLTIRERFEQYVLRYVVKPSQSKVLSLLTMNSKFVYCPSGSYLFFTTSPLPTSFTLYNEWSLSPPNTLRSSISPEHSADDDKPQPVEEWLRRRRSNSNKKTQQTMAKRTPTDIVLIVGWRKIDGLGHGGAALHIAGQLSGNKHNSATAVIIAAGVASLVNDHEIVFSECEGS